MISNTLTRLLHFLASISAIFRENNRLIIWLLTIGMKCVFSIYRNNFTQRSEVGIVSVKYDRVRIIDNEIVTFNEQALL